MFIRDIAFPAGLGASFTPPGGTWSLSGDLAVSGDISATNLSLTGAVKWGTTSSQPMISVSGAVLQVKLADDSAFASVKLKNITVTDNAQSIGSATGVGLWSTAAAGDASTAAFVNTQNTRTAGSLFEVYNNNSLRFHVGPDINGTAITGAYFPGNLTIGNLLIQGNSNNIIQNQSDADIAVFGNKAAGSTGTDCTIGSATATRTAGKLVSFSKNALLSEVGYVDYQGALSMAKSVTAFGVAPQSQQTSGANLTNNVTSGGTDDTIANFTDLSTYSNSAAAIRNNIYQLARKLKQINDGLRTYGFFT